MDARFWLSLPVLTLACGGGAADERADSGGGSGAVGSGVGGDGGDTGSMTPACADGLKNGDETDLDCGGSCEPCSPKLPCSAGEQCASELCIFGYCEEHAPPGSCDDGIQNYRESDVDCGGVADCNACGAGKHCNYEHDCGAGACIDNVCPPD